MGSRLAANHFWGAPWFQNMPLSITFFKLSLIQTNHLDALRTYHAFLAWVNAAQKPPGFLACCGNRHCQAPLQTAPKGQQQRARCSMSGSFAVFDFNSRCCALGCNERPT